MSDKSWKAFERTMAALCRAKRFPANMGHRLDFSGPAFVGQCKEVQSLSLEKLTQLVEEIDVLAALETPQKLGVVCVKVRRGQGQPSPALVVLSATTWAVIMSRIEALAPDELRQDAVPS